MKNVGLQFKARLRDANITQTELAKLLGISQSAVAAWVQKGVPAGKSAQVAGILDCDPADISHINPRLLPILTSLRSHEAQSDGGKTPSQQAVIDLINEGRLSRQNLDLLRQLILALLD